VPSNDCAEGTVVVLQDSDGDGWVRVSPWPQCKPTPGEDFIRARDALGFDCDDKDLKRTQILYESLPDGDPLLTRYPGPEQRCLEDAKVEGFEPLVPSTYYWDDWYPTCGSGFYPWAADRDGDGLPGWAGSPRLCVPRDAQPGPGWVSAYYLLQSETDCDDKDPTVWRSVYLDKDGDGFGYNWQCFGADQPGVKLAADGSDCDDADPTRWQRAYLDADGDGARGTQSTSIGALAPPYLTSSAPEDCDEASATIHPGAVEISGDGIDQDCGSGDAPTCLAIYSGVLEDATPVAADCADLPNLFIAWATECNGKCASTDLVVRLGNSGGKALEGTVLLSWAKRITATGEIGRTGEVRLDVDLPPGGMTAPVTIPDVPVVSVQIIATPPVSDCRATDDELSTTLIGTCIM